MSQIEGLEAASGIEVRERLVSEVTAQSVAHHRVEKIGACDDDLRAALEERGDLPSLRIENLGDRKRRGITRIVPSCRNARGKSAAKSRGASPFSCSSSSSISLCSRS